ncbi:SEC16 protein [Trichoderma virens Gv29-8]|uniref:Protein transport protein sec16 n=1 Tax=Hypocrea virens (strain Gv29-8 / FGSC 10586) TaxID=413071 RepID=G9MH83_HYPVG|nr:SEC16 protein [Trichoderma virens Gv29-8]EHK26731.1 SEC16 protein [Trichoderma virens Gv29-8]
MPNSVHDIPAADDDHAVLASPAEPLPETQETQDYGLTHEEEPVGLDHHESGRDTEDQAYSLGDDVEGDAGPASEDPEPHHETAEASAEPPAPAIEGEGDTAATSTRTAQHSSSMSFARTSHEVSFSDNDETEWTLSRTDTDPFKFMSPSDRTNSFPVVPLMAEDPERIDDMPLPSNQALDVLEETERDVHVEEEEYQADAQPQAGSDATSEPAKDSQRRHAPSRSIGGDIQWSEDAETEARYEEGVPLIPHSHVEPEVAASGENAHIPSFDDDNEDDDFFNQINQSGEDAASKGDAIPSLQRKSTMQVLAAANQEPISQQPILEETSEWDEEGLISPFAHVTEKPNPLEAHGSLNETGAPSGQDLSSKWEQAFASDDDGDDFLIEDTAAGDKEVDAAAFLGSDDEGLLDDLDEAPPPTQTAPLSSRASSVVSTPAFAPTTYVPTQQRSASASAYTPVTTPSQSSFYGVPSQGAAFQAAPQYGQAPPPQQSSDSPKAQSFADKSKGGYSSPYDLPSDLVTTTVKPRKRASLQQLQLDSSNSSLQPPPPPRSASMSATDTVPPGGIQKSPLLRHKSSFFEDLPTAPRPRSISRQSTRAVSPNPYALATSPHGPSPLSPPMATQIPPAAAPSQTARVNLVAPERVSPYAPLQSPNAPLPSPAANVSRYSPAPPPQGATSQSAPPPAGRYSPAPPASHPATAYAPAVSATPPQAVLPHLPRTSSPLAHFEISSDKPHASSSYEPRLTRVASLPPTREVEEEDDQSPSATRLSTTRSPPPLPTPSTQATLSPPKRPGSGYIPNAIPSTQPGFVPPPRAQTQSPGATRGGNYGPKPLESSRRPASSHSPASPPAARTTHAPTSHPRPPSQAMSMIAPTDGREQDPLQRWQGVPIISWGVGGTVVTSFPKSIPRYVMNQATPSMLRAPGEVKVRNIKDIESLQDRLAKFPGPLKGKSKKKEVLTWLSAGIESLAKELPDVSFHPQLSYEAKRAIERLLLWRILRVFVEYDGVLEGNPAAEKAVRDVLSPGTITPTADNDALFPTDPTISINGTAVTSMQADGADSTTMEEIRRCLLKGDRETAVWAAVDKRLWGHAMLISHTVSPDLYKRVAQEFVRKEVNHPGQNNESLAALYKVLSGNYDDCVDELVPVHARAGLQLVSTGSSSQPAKDAMEGLDKWRETLTLVLSNRSADDIRGLNALGKLLSSYGRAEAAHICFMFSKQISVYGGFDDPNVDFVLLGSDHRQNSHQIAKDTEALQLSEVYEYGLSLSGAPSAAAGAPHLAAYKLHHAIALAEYGFRDRALQYCDAILTAISSQTKRSPYHHQLLEAAVEDFMIRLKQAPKEESSSWMSKPTMNKVSDSMWNRFNKFVAGEDPDGATSTPTEESGPFARIGTPSMSRSPSVSNFDTLGISSPSYPGAGAPAATSALSSALSRYAPVSSQPTYGAESPQVPTTLSQGGRNSNEYNTSTYGVSPSLAGSPPHSNGFVSSGLGFQPMTPILKNEGHTGYQPYGHQESASSQPFSEEPTTGSSTQGYQPIAYGYEPPTNTTAPEADTNNDGVAGAPSSSGYEPPSFQSYGYEPPSYEPNAGPSAAENDDEPKPRRRGIMDDDDDDFPTSQPKGKTKAEKDRENEEMFRKAAEEDAKRAAEAAQAKKGWGFSSWFGGGKKEGGSPGELSSPGKPIKAKLGEASSFVYDPELKRWVNKKPGAEQVEAKAATPPPPKASSPRSVSGTPPQTPPPVQGRSSVPPSASFGSLAPPAVLNRAPSQESLGAPPMLRSMSSTSTESKPSSRPTTSMSNASSIDDLLNAGPRKPGQKKARKAGRYVDVMAK